LRIVSMRGWKRAMHFVDTGLHWIPTSPNIPESTTPLFCATTGLIGELGLVSIGIGSTFPFKAIGAPWINSTQFSHALQSQHLPGVHFFPTRFVPQYGLYKNEACHGVLLVITDLSLYQPVRTQCFILGVIKSLYYTEVQKYLMGISKTKKELFCKAAGGDGMLHMLMEERYPAWKMSVYQQEKRKQFLEKRKAYLLYP